MIRAMVRVRCNELLGSSYSWGKFSLGLEQVYG